MNKRIVGIAAIALAASLGACGTMQSAAPAASAASTMPTSASDQRALWIQVQQVLTREHFYHGDLTGYHDLQTTSALDTYQGAHHLNRTGTLTAETRTAMGL